MSSVRQLFGARIRSLRQQRGMTQQALGEVSDVGYKYLGAVERGHQQNPTLDVISRIAAGLEVEVYELFLFHHEATDPSELHDEIENLTKESDVEELQQIVKVIRAILR